ncbi:HET-domain-containing protein, partial [Lizonia empirigonia]
NAPEIITLAQTWLTRCLEQDGGICGMSTKFLPTRFVEITAVNGSLDSARLVLRDELPANAQYLTLSHCWGGLEMTSLKKSTLGNYRTKIPMSDLSKTFREALQVTAWLGYQYIWIDSLCIQQDSEMDWEKEAEMMGSVYRNSTCTLAATGAKDGNGGLFFERSALAFTDCLLYKDRTDEMLSIQRECEWPSPLASRAWAVQERHLSPRFLSSGSDMISWLCRRTEACEGPHAQRLELPYAAFPRLLNRSICDIAADGVWKAVVKQYSSCQLSFYKDKWPAFQGLA